MVPPMILREAAAHGMCFGVRDALAVLDRIACPERVTIHGELVHNGQVLAELDRRRFRRSPPGRGALPATDLVLVTAHGISDRERQRLLGAGKQLIDTTCPLVRKAHLAARTTTTRARSSRPPCGPGSPRCTSRPPPDSSRPGSPAVASPA